MIRDRVEYATQFLKDWRSVGSITPSSRFLVKKMLEPIDFSCAPYIVEFGAGNGIVTQAILKNMRSDALLLSFEINPLFCASLTMRLKDSRIKIFNDSAKRLLFYLKKFNIEKTDCLISSLPLFNLPKRELEAIIQAVLKSLSQKGLYIQYQYAPASYLQLKKLFRSVKVVFTPFNIPPAFIYICKL